MSTLLKLSMSNEPALEVTIFVDNNLLLVLGPNSSSLVDPIVNLLLVLGPNSSSLVDPIVNLLLVLGPNNSSLVDPIGTYFPVLDG